jgi:EcsC protein family
MAMRQEDLVTLETAVHLLEHASFAARLSNIVGKPLDLIGDFVPASAKRVISAASYKALETAVKVALGSMSYGPGSQANLLHKALVMASGAVTGAFGLPTLAVELPVSTTFMLRSIADIARNQGEDIEAPEAALECLQVFALGGPPSRADALEHGYFAARALLAKSITEAARLLAERGMLEEGAPVLVRFLTSLASRYGVVVTQKAAAQAVPVIGALGGAGVNYVFIDHFQKVALGHFTVRRLERAYGKDVVRAQYDRISRAA